MRELAARGDVDAVVVRPHWSPEAPEASEASPDPELHEPATGGGQDRDRDRGQATMHESSTSAYFLGPPSAWKIDARHRALARSWLDAGATAVLGQHAHNVAPAEW